MSRTKFLIVQCAIALGLLVLLEAGARVAHTVQEDLQDAASKDARWYTAVPGLGWAPTPNFSGYDICAKWRKFDRRGLLAGDAAKLDDPKRTKRVLFLGDSNTYGYCLEEDESFVAVANRHLPAFAMINLAMPGYTSFQGYRRLLELGDALRPDIIVASFNFNDRRYVLNKERTDSLRAFKASAAPDLLGTSYFFRQLTSLVGPTAPGSDDPVRLDQLHPRVSVEAYKQNLSNIADWGRRRGIPVVFVLLRDSPGEIELLRQGVQAFERSDYDTAIGVYEDVLAHPGMKGLSALAALKLAEALRRTGAADQANEVALEDDPYFSSHGGYVIRSDARYNAALRDVAAKHSVLLVDAAQELEKNPDVFFDLSHFTAEGHETVGRLVADALKRAGSTLNPRISGTDRN
jgi:lysophospholipase L1-like esterase